MSLISILGLLSSKFNSSWPMAFVAYTACTGTRSNRMSEKLLLAMNLHVHFVVNRSLSLIYAHARAFQKK